MPVSSDQSSLLRSSKENHTQDHGSAISNTVLNPDALRAVVSFPGMLQQASTARLLIPGKAVSPTDTLTLDYALWQGDQSKARDRQGQPFATSDGINNVKTDLDFDRVSATGFSRPSISYIRRLSSL